LAAACIAGDDTRRRLLLTRSIRWRRVPNMVTRTVAGHGCGHLPVSTGLLARRQTRTPEHFGDTALIIATRTGDVALVKRAGRRAATRIRNRIGRRRRRAKHAHSRCLRSSEDLASPCAASSAAAANRCQQIVMSKGFRSESPPHRLRARRQDRHGSDWPGLVRSAARYFAASPRWRSRAPAE